MYFRYVNGRVNLDQAYACNIAFTYIVSLHGIFGK